MSSEVLTESLEAREDMCTTPVHHSPMPMERTAESSCCTSPLSLPSDVPISGNVTSNEDNDDNEEEEVEGDDEEEEDGDAGEEDDEREDEEEEEDDDLEGMETLNLTLPKVRDTLAVDSDGEKKMHNANTNRIAEEQDLFESLVDKARATENRIKAAAAASNQQSALTAALQDLMPTTSPEFIQLLLEYRQVLLDVLSRSFKANGSDAASSQQQQQQQQTEANGVTLPLQCKCGLNSKLSNQIIRCSSYVHQLELRFCSLIDLSRSGESKYIPKRPNFVNAVSPFGSSVVSQGILGNLSALMASNGPAAFPAAKTSRTSSDKKISKQQLMGKQQQQQQQQQLQMALQLQAQQQQHNSFMYSGASSINSSLNGDDEDGDSEEEEEEVMAPEQDVRAARGAAAASASMIAANNFAMDFAMDNGNMEMKPILKPYLESNMMKQQQQQLKQQFLAATNDDCSEDEKPPMFMVKESNGLGPNINSKIREQIMQMHRVGVSVANIGRRLGLKGKIVRKIVASFGPFGMGMMNANMSKKGDKNNLILRDTILRLYSQGNSYTQISRQTNVTKQTVMKIIRQYVDDNKIVTKGPTHMSQRNLVPNASSSISSSNSLQRFMNSEDAFENQREMINFEHDDDEDDYDHANEEFSEAALQSMTPKSKSMLKARNGMSLMQSAYNGQAYNTQAGNSMAHPQSSPQQQQQQPPRDYRMAHGERYKPYDVKGRNQSSDMFNHRTSKMNQIVPPLNKTVSHYTLMQRQKHEMKMMNKNGFLKNNELMEMMRPKSSKLKDSLLIPEADKNNNTTLANCNSTLGSAGNSSNGDGSLNGETLPPIPPALLEPTSDSESANLVPKNFTEGFPTGIMNSLNPNRATKLTLEDFNIVWQLRSQHWTHNQIRKFFQQRGKSISKSSISRIMNGKQRNFQQFFNVVPSGSC